MSDDVDTDDWMTFPSFPEALAAAEAGDPAAMVVAYRMYASGSGVERSGPTALAWLRRAAEAGHVAAMVGLAAELGQAPETLTWLRRAVELGSGRAAASLGWAYEQGKAGLTPDLEAALAHYRTALERGESTLGPSDLADKIKKLEKKVKAAAKRAGKPPTPEELVGAALAEHGLKKRKAVILAALRPSIRLVQSEAAVDDATVAVGASKLGGAPDLEPGTPWPTDGGRALEFLAQVDLAAVASVAAAATFETGLPREGLLSFFYDVEAMPWGFAGERGWRVLHQRGALERRSPPEAVQSIAAASLTASVEPTLPFVRTMEVRDMGLSDKEVEKYWDVRDAVPAAKGERHRMLGHADATQGDMRRRLVYDAAGADLDAAQAELESQARSLVLLLQLGSFWHSDLLWGDDGRLFFWLEADALARGDFAATRLQLQA